MPAEIQPPELAALVDYQERSRSGDWSLRSALCRYAQPQPQRVSAVLELVRRIDGAVQPVHGRIAKEGPAIWQGLEAGGSPDDPLVAVLGVAQELDRLGDVLAAWAEDRHASQPEAEVDAAVAEVARRLDELGVPREERMRPPPGARARS
jgi:hypothetical protein